MIEGMKLFIRSPMPSIMPSSMPGRWILRHLHGLLLLPGVHRPELLRHEVVHKESHALNHAQQHATTTAEPTMLLGPCLAAITAPAAAPDMMEFQGSSFPLMWANVQSKEEKQIPQAAN